MAWMAWNFQHRDVQPEGDQLRPGQQSRMKFTDFPVIETIETFFETIPIDTLWLKWCVEMHGMLLYHLYTAKPHRSWHVNVSQKWFRPVRRIFRASSSEMKLGTISSSREYMPHSMAQGDITITPHTHTQMKKANSPTQSKTHQNQEHSKASWSISAGKETSLCHYANLLKVSPVAIPQVFQRYWCICHYKKFSIWILAQNSRSQVQQKQLSASMGQSTGAESVGVTAEHSNTQVRKYKNARLLSGATEKIKAESNR